MATIYEQLNSFIDDLKETRDIVKTCKNVNITSYTFFNDWYSKEKSNIEPFASFQSEVNEILGLTNSKNIKSTKKRKKIKKRPKRSKDEAKEKLFNEYIIKYVSNLYGLDDKLNFNDETKHLIDLADNCINNNELNRAIEYYDEILSKNPNFYIFNRKGCLLIKLENYDEAIKCFDSSLNYKIKNNYKAHIGKSIGLFNLLKLHECNASQIDWDNKFVTMMNHIDVACLINNKGYIFKAGILNGLGQYNGALSSINELLDKEKVEREIYYDALLEKSHSYRQLGEYRNAINCYDEILKLGNDINILLNKGELLFILKYYAQAVNTFNLVLEKDSQNINALMYLGLIYPNFNKFNEALNCFNKILEKDNSLSSALIYKVELLVNLHRYDEAIDNFKQCSENLSNDFIKLIEFAQEQSSQNNKTEYYAVSKTDLANFKYVYIYMENGFRKIYGINFSDLKMKVLDKNRLWTNITYKRFIEVPLFHKKNYSVIKYIRKYYNHEINSKYDKLISEILNNDFLENLDHNKLELTTLLNSSNDFEKKIIKNLMNTMQNKLNFSHARNITGYFGVSRLVNSNEFRWSYSDLVKNEYYERNIIYATSLEELEEKVRSEGGLLWYIFDKNLALESQEWELDN